jgi:hypothetical protein
MLSIYSCDNEELGCIDSTACNYDSSATDDDGSCDYSCIGCTDSTACNYDSSATDDNESCLYDNPIDIVYIEDTILGSVADELVSNIHIQNNSCDEVTLMVRKIFPPSSASAYFCFNNICFPSSTIVSPNPLSLSSGETDDYFKGYLIADQPGLYEVTYRFYLENDPMQNHEVTITYDVN